MTVSSDTIDKVRTIGLIAKGAVYSIIGLMTALAAFSLGGQATNRNDIVPLIERLPAGKPLVVILGLGLLAYAAWRFYKAFADPDKKGKKAKGLIIRIGYAGTALFYAAFAYISFRAALANKGSGGGAQKQSMASTLLREDWGTYLLVAVAAGLIIFGLYQIYQGITGKYLEMINKSSGYDSIRKSIKISGLLGFSAKGIVFGIIGWFLVQAAIEKNASKVIDTKGVFNYLWQQENGNILMGIVAIGLLLYGIFNFFVARYSRFTTLS